MDWTAYLFILKPAYQALLFLLLTPILVFAFRPKRADAVWVTAGNIFALFLIVNAALLWFSDSPWHYFFYSIGFAVGYLLCIAILVPGLIRVLKLKSSEESAMAFLILIYQPVALLLVMLVKWVIIGWF
jgi:hypothetical protein